MCPGVAQNWDFLQKLMGLNPLYIRPPYHPSVVLGYMLYKNSETGIQTDAIPLPQSIARSNVGTSDAEFRLSQSTGLTILILMAHVWKVSSFGSTSVPNLSSCSQC